MADITKCSGDGCPYKHYCRRYTAPSGPFQSFFAKPPVKPDGICAHFYLDTNPKKE